jgi:hypothetical protein
MILLNAFGNVASILGLVLSLYVLWREVLISDEVHELKQEEEQWREDDK